MRILETTNLCYSYPGGPEVLHNINFHADQGEFVALLGANGCGKTTLFQHFNRLLRPAAGTIRLWGKELPDLSQTEVFSRVGLVFQDPNDQLFAAGVFEDVSYGPTNLGLDQAEISRRVQLALERVGMWDLRERSIHQLSYGQKKRVAIAGILAMQPELIVLDEPTAGLDPRTAASLMRMLKSLQAEQGLTIILSTHEVDIVPVYCDRAYVMQEGRILLSGTPTEIFQDPGQIRQAYLRLPRVAHLWEVLRSREGMVAEANPLTVREARLSFRRFLEANYDLSAGGNSGRPGN